jgi:hypothetical protein
LVIGGNQGVVKMGQAKNRKAAIAALKSNGPRKVMGRFLVRGDIQTDGTVIFPTDTLDSAQAGFAKLVEQTINQETVPELAKQGVKATHTDYLAIVMYNRADDFTGGLMGPVEGGPDAAWAEYTELFNPEPGLALGSTLTRKELVSLGTEQAGMLFDMLNEGGIWRWPNANAVLQRKGNHMVVIDRI